MPKLTKEKIDKILELRSAGYGYRSISERVGISSETAHKYGKGVKMKEDRRYGRGGSVKELVKKESRKLIDIRQIRPSHQKEFDRFISEQVDTAIKSLAQSFGLASNRFVGLFGFGRSVANIVFDTEESETYTVLPVLKLLFFGEQKLPALPLRRKIFIRRITSNIILLNWDKIKKILGSEEDGRKGKKERFE